MNAELGGRLPETAVRAVYREIMSASLALEKDLTIAYLGPRATAAHEAARSKFGASVQYSAQANVADVFDTVARGSADYGVVPIENSAGAVAHTLNVFVDTDLRICAQILSKADKHLLAKTARPEIRRVYSHPNVFTRTGNWLRRNLSEVELIEVSSTCRAAELAAKERGAGAIACRMAAELHGLRVLEPALADRPDDTIRFLVIGPRSSPPTGNDQTTLLFGIRDTAGGLCRALEALSQLQLPGTVESRRSQRTGDEFVFCVDVDGHADEPRLIEAFRALEPLCTFLKILGTYPKTARS
jgi:chorismate mutase/prephenate dehydratase